MNKFMTILLILFLVFSNMPSVGAMPIEPRFDTTELSDGTLMITKYNGTETEVDIPSELGGRLITNIGSAAFYSRNLTRITIPDSVKFIGSSAFGSNSLTTVHIPEGVRTIGPYAFYSNKLTEVSIPDNVTSIEERAFQMNQLTNVELLGNDLIVGDFAFANNKLTSISIANGVKKIGESAFRYNRLTSIEIPGSVETIGQFAFSGSFNGLENELTDVKIQNGVKSIGSNAFFIGSLTSVTIPESVENLDSSAFSYHLLEEVTFEGNPTIGSYGLDQAGPRYKEFKGWYTDEEFTSEWNGTLVPEGKKLYGKRLPAPPQEVSAVKGLKEATVSFTGPTHMGGNAVTNYSVKVYINGTEQTDLLTTGNVSPITVTGLTPGTAYTFKVMAKNATGDSVLSQATTAVTPVAVYETSENSDGTVTLTAYNDTKKEIVIPNEINGKVVSKIGDNVFKDKGLTSVQLPEQLSNIGENAFSGNQLTNIVIHRTENAIYIGKHAFSNNKITQVTLPLGVVKVEDYAFSGNELTTVQIPSSLGTIGESAFSHNEITSLHIPISLSTIGKSAFSHNKITNLIVPPFTVIGESAFSYNELTNVTFHIRVARIAEDVFSHNKLTTVTIPENIQVIGSNAFSSNQIEHVSFEGSPTIGADAFKQDATVFPEFVGWFTDKELRTEWSGTSVVSGAELYAKRKPDVPTEVQAIAGRAKATVSFTGPTHTGGNIVTGYKVKVFEGGQEVVELETTGLASPIIVNKLKPRKSYTFKVLATNEAGDSKESELSDSVVPRAPFIPTVPDNPVPQPITEIIPLPADTGSVVTTATITRTTDPAGKKKDEIHFSPKHADEIVPKLTESGNEWARIVIPDTKDEVSELDISFHQDAMKTFRGSGIGLEVFTENARLLVPTESIANVTEHLYFRVLPIKDEKQKKEIEERAKQEEVVKSVAGNLRVEVAGRPMTIETNMPNQPVDIILPLKGLMIPTDAKEREKFFNKLGVFIEHSDGEKVFVKGEVVQYKDGEFGLKFTVEKFSTFTIIQMEKGWKVPTINDQYTGQTTVLEQLVPIDKVWTITFNQAANPETVNASTVYIYDEKGKKIDIESQLTNQNRSITITPVAPYEPDTSYYVYLEGSIESSRGKALGNPLRYVFKTKGIENLKN